MCPPTRQAELIGNLDFSGKKKAEEGEVMKQVRDLLEDMNSKK
jgi:hypothetical protein